MEPAPNRVWGTAAGFPRERRARPAVKRKERPGHHVKDVDALLVRRKMDHELAILALIQEE